MLTTETTIDNSPFSTNSLLKEVNDYLVDLEGVNTADGLFKFISSNFISLSKCFIGAGDQEHLNIEKGEPINQNEVYLLHFSLSEPFKDVAFLHRDVLLELQISRNKRLENSVSEEAIDLHYNNSKFILTQATEAFSHKMELERDLIYQSEKSGQKIRGKIKHRKNPWDIYKGHFNEIHRQIKDISGSSAAMAKTIKTFEDIRSHNNNFLELVSNEAEMLKSQMGEGIKELKELKETSQITKVIEWVDGVISRKVKDQDLQEMYMTTIEQKIKMLSVYSIPVSTQDGLLFTRKMDFNRAVKKWIDFEILPLLIDLMEKKSNINSYFKHNILNLKIGLRVEKNSASLEGVTSQLQSLKGVHATLSEYTKNIKTLVSEIQRKFDTHFQATLIYSKADFLEVSMHSSLTQFASDQSTLFSGLKKQWSSRLAKFNSKYESGSLFNTENKIEMAMACINYRMFKEANAYYDTLFLNKNFMGDLFLLPRKEQEQSVMNSIEQWENGANKAIMLIGDSLSGKSTFVNHLAHRHFAKRSVVLERNSKTTFNGRKFATTSDLDDALEHIKKGMGGNRSILIIDDLELWKDDKHSLLVNIRSLIDFIESESDEILVLVTISEQMRDHLDKRLRFSEIFTSTIDLSKATFEEIYKAVMLRHGASHKTLVSKVGEKMTPAQIEHSVYKLAKSLDFNLGEVLQAWTYGATMTDDNKVVYDQGNYPFKDFFTSEEVIILKYVLLYKQVNELTLKSFVGSRFNNHYKSALKRLVNTKVLLRGDLGLLHLNPVLTKDIKQLLIYKGIMT
jgi:hypothetical protein